MTHHAAAALSKADQASDRPPEHRYLLLRAALAAGGSGLAGLSRASLQDVTERGYGVRSPFLTFLSYA